MTTQLQKDIMKLKENYPYEDNLFKYKKIITEKEFTTKMKYFIDNYKENIIDLKIVDIKDYYNYKYILKVYDNGIMKGFSNKKLKYIKYNNENILELYNKREIEINRIQFKQKYDKIYKKKKIIVKDKYKQIIEFIVSMEEKETKSDNKTKIFYINIINKSSNNFNNFEKVINIIK